MMEARIPQILICDGVLKESRLSADLEVKNEFTFEWGEVQL